MEHRNTIRRGLTRAIDTEQLLATYYSQLLQWGAVLTRGDAGKAQEIVQEFCLHFTLTRPDLSEVANLDGYLYTCLRNIYVSGLARASREALQFVSIADFDSFDFAMSANQAGDPLQRQNDLRRICAYAIGRKEQSKSASYFILHFFHGYARREIAELVRLPISAIYNKLKLARDEVKAHLNASGKLRSIDRTTVPAPRLSWSLVSSAVLFKELREAILHARASACQSAETLLACYSAANPSPVSCVLLAHLVSCEPCLAIVDSHFRRPTLKDREPLDGFGSASGEASSVEPAMTSQRSMLEFVERRWGRIHEHRPRTLSIAVNGKIVAFHDVQSAESTLSTRIDNPEKDQFVEVFSEQDVRLALIPVGELPPDGQHVLTQRTSLSDARWLELKLTFDGLGLIGQVAYFDPILAADATGEEAEDFALEPVPIDLTAPSEEKRRWQPAGAFEALVRRLGAFVQTPAMAWALMVAIFLGSGAYLGYRYSHPAWRDVLARAQAVAEVPLPAETLHQTLRIEDATDAAKGAVLGTVDIWRSSDRHAVRRLYDARQQLLATSIDNGDGTVSDRIEENVSMGDKERQLVDSGVWRSDLSSAAIDTGRGAVAIAFRGGSGFGVTQREDGSGGILSRTLVLDRDYRVQAERVRFRTAAGVSEVRLVQTLLRRVPNSNVPESTFPRSPEMTPQVHHSQPTPGHDSAAGLPGDASGANLEVALLFELFQQKVDVGQPIEVAPIAGGRVRIAGTLADAHRLAALRDSIAALPNAGCVDFHVRSVAEAASAIHRGNAIGQELLATGSDAPAAGLVRDAMVARGLKGAALKSAEQEFAASALAHAQAALQHAYALDRLGSILKRAGNSSLDPATRVKWAQMADRHSAAARSELEALRLQLDSISAGIAGIPAVDTPGIADAAAFIRATSELRINTQAVNAQVVELFAGSATNMTQARAQDALARLRSALPMAEANRMNLFASRLANSNPAAQSDVGEMHTR